MTVEKQINQIAEKLINIFDDINTSFTQGDIFPYMVTCFYYKQRLHLISVLQLKNCRDSEILCRCMIEGMAILYHAKDNPDFALRWVQQGDIENLKMLEDKQKDRIFVDEGKALEIKNRAKDLLNLIKEKREKDIKQTGRELKYDDFSHQKIPMSQLIENFLQKDDFWKHAYKIYDHFSKWNHWNPGAVSQYIHLEENKLSLEENYDLEIITKTYAMFCLNHTSKIFNETFSCGKELNLSKIENEILNIFEKNKK